MKVATQTEAVRRLRATNLELIFSDHNAYCLPPCQNKCPSHIDIPGFLKQNAEGNWRESSRIFKRTIPFPSVLGRVCPAPCEEHCRRDEVDEAIAIRDSHRYAGDQVLKAMLNEGIDPPVPFEVQAKTGRRVAVIGSGPAGMAAAYYLLIAGHEVTVFERDAAPGGMLRYGIPQYRLPKVEVLEAEYESVTRLGGRDRVQPGPRPGLQPGRPPGPGLRRGPDHDRLLRHEQAGHPQRGCRGRPRRPRIPQDRDPRAGLSRPRRQADRGHRRWLHLDGLHPDLGPPGRLGGDPGLSPRHEGHACLGRGPRGDRGRSHGHLPGGPGAGPGRREGQGLGRRVHSPAAGRAGRLRPAAARAGPRDRVHDRVRPGPAGDRPGPRPELVRPGLGRPRGHQAAPPEGRRGDLRNRPPGRLRLGRRADRGGDRRRRDRRGPAQRLRRRRLRQGPRPGGPQDPPDAGRAAARVPLDRALHQRGQGAALPAQGDGRRAAQQELRRVRDPLQPGRGHGREHPLPAVHLRGDRLLRPAPAGDRVRHDPADPGAGASTRAPATGASPRTASPGSTTTTSATTATPSSCASRRAASTAAAAPRCARRSSARPATTSCGSASTRWSRRPST